MATDIIWSRYSPSLLGMLSGPWVLAPWAGGGASGVVNHLQFRVEGLNVIFQDGHATWCRKYEVGPRVKQRFDMTGQMVNQSQNIRDLILSDSH